MDTFDTAASLFQHGNVSFDAAFTRQLIASQITVKNSIDVSKGSIRFLFTFTYCAMTQCSSGITAGPYLVPLDGPLL